MVGDLFVGKPEAMKARLRAIQHPIRERQGALSSRYRSPDKIIFYFILELAADFDETKTCHWLFTACHGNGI